MKVRYNADKYFMAGNQWGFDYFNTDDLQDVFDDMEQKLDHYIKEVYKLESKDVVYIQATFRKKDKKVLSELGYKQDNVKHFIAKDINETRKLVTIPVSINPDLLGESLPVERNKGIITNIKLNINNEEINFLDKILLKSSFLKKGHRNKIMSFDSDYTFYLIKGKNNRMVVLAVKINKYSVDKIIFTLTGNLLNRVTDLLEGDILKRITGSKTMFIKKGEVIKVEEHIKLQSIPVTKSTTSRIEDSTIGSIDTEVYTAKDGTSKVHAIGFKSILDKNPVMYYIDPYVMDGSDAIILQFIDKLLRSKYSKIRWYCHNLGGYDIVFILKVLFLFNDKVDEVNSILPQNKQPLQKYIIRLILKDNVTLKCVVSKGNKSVVMLDSYPILNKSLDKLGKDFGVKPLKGVLPDNTKVVLLEYT